MSDPRLNELLKWGIENSDTSKNDPTAEAPKSQLTPELMAALMGGPSDADLMKAAMEVITSTEANVTLENKLIAFDNFEQLIEGLDNANNMENMRLWPPLLAELKDPEMELRKMAAWCIGTAVQNNLKTQERLFAAGGIPTLVEVAMDGKEHSDVRRKAVYALSSACRNYQPAMDACVDELSKRGAAAEKVDATDMESVDAIMDPLRESAKAA